MNRREFIRMMGVASGTTLLGSCGFKGAPEKLIPYLIPPDDGVIPGEAVFFSSTCTECPAGCGMSVRVREGRPVKLEGNPGHPVGGGALCVRGQAGLGRLYHPRRLKAPLAAGGGGDFTEISWDEAFSRIGEVMAAGGKKRAYLSGRTTGTLASLVDEFCGATGVERLPSFEPLSHANLRRAYEMFFGRRDVPHYAVERADFLLTVGADILDTFLSPVEFASAVEAAKNVNALRWMHVEPHVSLTGLNAAARGAVRPGSEAHVLAWLVRRVAAERNIGDEAILDLVDKAPHVSLEEAAGAAGLGRDFLIAAAEGLVASKRPLVVVGGVSTSGPNGLETAVLGVMLQIMCGCIGDTVRSDVWMQYAAVGTPGDLESVADSLDRNDTGVLFISRCDPVGVLGTSSRFARSLPKADMVIGMGMLMNETLRRCDIVLPVRHALESWDDCMPRSDVVSVVQPALEPLYPLPSEGDILLKLLAEMNGAEGTVDYRDYLFERLKGRHDDDEIEEFIAEGHMRIETAEKPGGIHAREAAGFVEGMRLQAPAKSPVLICAPSIRTFDGRSADLPLLSEIPDPLTTVSYGEWISIAPGDAANMQVRDLDELEVSFGGGVVKAPAKIQPGLRPGVLMILNGTGGISFFGMDAGGEGLRAVEDLRVSKTGRRRAIPILSASTSQHGRGLVPDDDHFERHEERKSFYPEHEYEHYHWTIAVDLDACIGCSACAAACYIENNVPVVGGEEHLKGRELSWLRIEPYYDGGGSARFLPMMCQQCDNAPCESVCPVIATYHNPEGLNAQVYNRCVGTRYCSNNCPYKVRRFNWFEYRREPPLDMMLNPDVSVRDRGIMEKCTFCVQRIRAAKDKAKDEGRLVREGEIVPACAQTCPTHAITFGNILDEKSAVYKLSKSPRAYRVFEELGTEPSIYYLKRRGRDEA
jgi:molybdopterin-containing oxidoreductase family iron-sulfur binding subunit